MEETIYTDESGRVLSHAELRIGVCGCDGSGARGF